MSMFLMYFRRLKLEIDELKEHLALMRKEAKGKKFDEAPELFKNIEGLKVRIAWLTNEE